MAITSNFNPAKSMQALKQKQVQIEAMVVRACIKAGERFKTEAHEQVQSHAQGTYMDRTGNLRRSIGYYVLKDGVVIYKSQMYQEHINWQHIQPFIGTGYQLIGIAGMEYASHVEAKGYNVITNQQESCFVNLSEYVQEIKRLASVG